MSPMLELIERNRAFAQRNGHADAQLMPRVPVYVITCLDPRVDPSGFLGVAPSDAFVVRNVGGRVHGDTARDVVFISSLAEMFVSDGPLFEIAIVHHDQCGAGFLADPEFRSSIAERSGVAAEQLERLVVIDPEITVAADVDELLATHGLSSRVTVSGHVYDLGSGLLRTIRPPASSPNRSTT